MNARWVKNYTSCYVSQTNSRRWLTRCDKPVCLYFRQMELDEPTVRRPKPFFTAPAYGARTGGAPSLGFNSGFVLSEISNFKFHFKSQISEKHQSRMGPNPPQNGENFSSNFCTHNCALKLLGLELSMPFSIGTWMCRRLRGAGKRLDLPGKESESKGG